MSQTELGFVNDLSLPQGAVAINRRAWFRDLDGLRAVFVDQTPFYCYPLDDHQPLPLTDDDGELQPPAVPPPAVPQIEAQAIEPQVIEPQVTETQAIEATSIPYASPLDRACTALGLIEEAPIEFQSAEGVPCGGALLGLALLAETHLLEEARAVYGQLRNGWYGLRSLVWTLVVMALVRIKRPEQIKHHDPAGRPTFGVCPPRAGVAPRRRSQNDPPQAERNHPTRTSGPVASRRRQRTRKQSTCAQQQRLGLAVKRLNQQPPGSKGADGSPK
ncbi:MAG: hypothetical protein O3C40_22585 [Planctomycetota bacterium]|nr:hypothetical protein [Planctomycetota bacterium]